MSNARILADLMGTSTTVPSSKLSLSASNLPAGSVLQVKSATKTDKQTTTSATPADVTGLSVNITPSSASSEILVLININYGGNLNMYGAINVLRDSTKIVEGTFPTGSQIAATLGVGTGSGDSSNYKIFGASHTFKDSPATTSALTYKVQFAATYGSTAFTINAPHSTANNTYTIGGTSTITVMEIAG